VVLVPQYGGGMENATITFDNELSGQGVLGFGLSAHELAHQWFGDWVTMHTYDDVWVKEGMATLLAAEADRARRDRDGTGRWFGSDFNFNPDDAVVDPALTGLDKYTSGPYERAAWLMTQIRARIGDAAYWAGARKVLADHARGTITGEQFVRSFAPALDEATIARILAALPRRGAPIDHRGVDAGGGRDRADVHPRRSRSAAARADRGRGGRRRRRRRAAGGAADDGDRARRRLPGARPRRRPPVLAVRVRAVGEYFDGSSRAWPRTPSRR
jgi:hypothetical protein